MKHHNLKTWPNYFTQAANGSKPFELRYNDRGFKPGDYVVLMEYDNVTKIYSGQALTGRITYVLKLDKFIAGADPNWVILGLPQLTLMLDNKPVIKVWTDDLTSVLSGDSRFKIAYDQSPHVGQTLVIKEYQTDREAKAIITAIEPVNISREVMRQKAFIVGFKSATEVKKSDQNLD